MSQLHQLRPAVVARPPRTSQRLPPPQLLTQPAPSPALVIPGLAVTAASLAAVLSLAAPPHALANVSLPALERAPAAARPTVLADLASALIAVAPEPAGEMSDADAITEEIALPPELREFMEATIKGPVKNAQRLSELRRAVGFDRSPDGRVYVFTEDGEPLAVKADMGVAGLLLLRDAGGYIYFLPASDNSALRQIDLSDDAVVAQLFANHAWEELLEPLEVFVGDETGAAAAGSSDGGTDADRTPGRLEQLRMTEREFRSVLSLASGAQEMPEEPLEALDARER